MKAVQFVLMFVLLSGCNTSSATSIQECASLYHDALNNVSLNTPLKLANYLSDNSSGCIEYDEFSVWLGVAYQEAGEYKKSVEVATKALPNATEYKANLLQILAEAELRTGSEEKAVKQAEKIARDFPDYIPILGFLGEVAFRNKNWKVALDLSKKMFEVDQSALSLLSQSAAYHQLGRDKEAVDTFNRAIQLEPKRIAKTTGVLEAIFSLANLERWSEAAELAKKHMQANPKWHENPTFFQAAKELGLVEE